MLPPQHCASAAADRSCSSAGPFCFDLAPSLFQTVTAIFLNSFRGDPKPETCTFFLNPIFFFILNPNSIKPWPHRDHGVIVAGWVGSRPSCPRRCAHTCGVDRAAVQAVHAGRGDFFIDHLSRHAPTVCAYRSDRTSACASYASGGMAFLGRGQATKPKPGRVRPPRWRMRSPRLASPRLASRCGRLLA